MSVQKGEVRNLIDQIINVIARKTILHYYTNITLNVSTQGGGLPLEGNVCPTPTFPCGR